jgi:hypothetical protein
MRHDMNGNVIPEEIFKSDRKFYAVEVTINSVVWESGYHIYEADSPEEALAMYESEKELPIDIEYTGHIDQEYRYDELGEDDPELIDNNASEIQWILRREEEERRSKLL